MLSLVPRDAERIDTNAPGGLDALLWYMRRLYHFGAIVSEPLIHSQFLLSFDGGHLLSLQPPSPCEPCIPPSLRLPKCILDFSVPSFHTI